MMPRRRDSYSGSSRKLRLARAQVATSTTPTNEGEQSMTTAILILGPLTVIIGCLYWVMSLGKEQTALNAELWPKLRK
jgi:hypothetical protein